MKLGFTGTEAGMTQDQKELFEWFMRVHAITEFHHGDCIGADAEAHQIARESPNNLIIIGHPPRNPRARAWCVCDELRQEKAYLERNREIVAESEFLIACPKEFREIIRSGTWATFRYAHRIERLVIYPDGRMVTYKP